MLDDEKENRWGGTGMIVMIVGCTRRERSSSRAFQVEREDVGIPYFMPPYRRSLEQSHTHRRRRRRRRKKRKNIRSAVTFYENCLVCAVESKSRRT